MPTCDGLVGPPASLQGDSHRRGFRHGHVGHVDIGAVLARAGWVGVGASLEGRLGGGRGVQEGWQTKVGLGLGTGMVSGVTRMVIKTVGCKVVAVVSVGRGWRRGCCVRIEMMTVPAGTA